MPTTALVGCGDLRPPFSDATAASGLPVAEGTPWPDGTYELYEITAGGVGLLDHDGDGDLDILQTNAPPPGRPREPAPNRLWERTADGTYRDVAARAGLDEPGYGQGVAIGDVNDDGHPDVFVANYGPDALYLNRGDGTFERQDDDAGLDAPRWTVSATFCDYDADGDLDLYVVHYVRYTTERPCVNDAGRREYCGPQVFPGEPDHLYRNEGGGRFVDVTEAAGLVLPDGGERARGLGVVCADLTRDGRPDFYVANDGEANQLWVNRGDGTFRDEAVMRGIAVNEMGRPEASMGLTVGDFDGDQELDVFATHLSQESNTLYRSKGGAFADVTGQWEVSEGSWLLTGFGCGFLDFDNDGDLDLAIANGAVRVRTVTLESRVGPFWARYAEPNQLLENVDGRRFVDLGPAAGPIGSDVEVSRGLALGDLDDDGDVDVVVTNLDNTMRLYRNEAGGRGHWLGVRAVTHGRDALGATVVLTAGGATQSKLAIAGSSYGSSNDPRVHFGLGETEGVDALVVAWPDGRRESFPVEGVDRHLTVTQGLGTPVESP